jgi:hypothetical protein
MAKKIRLGKYQGEVYVMSVRPKPSKIEDTKAVSDFAISIFFKKNGETHQVVRIDDAHGYVHMDRLYSERDDIKQDMSELDFWASMDYLMQNWQKFAKYYQEKEG